MVARLEVNDLTIDIPRRRLLTAAAFTVEAGECVAIVGASGIGKTSLLNCVAGVGAPTSGSVRIAGTNLTERTPAGRAEFRLRHIGIVFQFGELLPELSLIENVALPLRLLGSARNVAQAQAARELDRLGLADHANAHPDTLSGGEVQRAAIARALVHGPSLLLADEPTGMLDSDSTRRVAALLAAVARECDVAVLVVTHDPLVAAVADRALKIQDCRVIEACDLTSAESRP
jgi:putative ABC transport system ATP-binding protein